MEIRADMNDYRSEAMKRFHAATGKPQQYIDNWNEGYEFYLTHYPEGGPQTPAHLAMQYAKFSIIDMSYEAEAYWNGYEAATIVAYESGRRMGTEPASEEDIQWAMGELARFLRGDRK
jgi:hypothetical protein